jgi:hypothetical protein
MEYKYTHVHIIQWIFYSCICHGSPPLECNLNEHWPLSDLFATLSITDSA